MSEEFTINAIAEGPARLDLFLKAAASGNSRASLQKAIREGGCLVDGVTIRDPDYKIRAGQKAVLNLRRQDDKLQPEEGEVRVIWRDDSIAVCDKPPGLTVHPCPSQPENTLAQRLLRLFPEIGRMTGFRPGIVHRLDRDTSGVIVVALNEHARLKLADAFARRQIHKEYLALVAGLVSGKGECREPVGRHPTSRVKMAVVPINHGGKPAASAWQPLWAGSDGLISLLRVGIESGRTHQIRVHMAHIGHPILGDRLYAPQKVARMAPRQMLHAWKLSLNHPLTGQSLQFTARPPDDFYQAAIANAGLFLRVILTGNPGCGKSTLRKDLAGLGFATASADDLVAQLYTEGGVVADWLRINAGGIAVNQNGQVDKSALFPFLTANPAMKLEFERYIHELTREKLTAFWKEQRDLGQDAAVAEIPLYFESGWQKLNPDHTLTIGVHCPTATRWQRIVATRGWTREKLETIENWQWDEARKMAACDHVIDNESTPEHLRREAEKIAGLLAEKSLADKNGLLRHLKDLCQGSEFGESK